MAAPEMFIDQIVTNVRSLPGGAPSECVFFGFSDQHWNGHDSVQAQAAVLCRRVGSVVSYQLYIGDTGKNSGYFSSQAQFNYPLPESQQARRLLPGCIVTERAIINDDGRIEVNAGGTALRVDEYYRAKLGGRLALLTSEC